MELDLNDCALILLFELGSGTILDNELFLPVFLLAFNPRTSFKVLTSYTNKHKLISRDFLEFDIWVICQ